jgi:hypothetical protein
MRNIFDGRPPIGAEPTTMETEADRILLTSLRVEADGEKISFASFTSYPAMEERTEQSPFPSASTTRQPREES